MALFRFAGAAESEPISGAQVYLRPPRMADFEAWRNLRQLSRSFLEPWEPSWSDDEFLRGAFRHRVRIYEQRAQDDEGHSFFIFAQAGDTLLGGVTLSHIRRGVSQSASLGYWMGAPHAGKGHMKDALYALIAVAAPRFYLHRLEAACLPRNDRSRHLLLTCGFEPEGFAKAYVKIAGRWEDHLLFGRQVG